MGAPDTLDLRASGAWVRRLALTTPGVVGIVAVAVAACCVVAGVVCATQFDRRMAERNALLERSEPFAYSAQNLYAALSAADAAAASAYLSGGIQTPPMRARYRQALADASSALADATAGAADADTRTAVAEISAQLAAYSGLVESARANNTQGFVIGSAYLREASSLMHGALLQDVKTMYTDDLAEVDQHQSAVGSVPKLSLALLVGVLAVICVGSVIVFARTNRIFNVGLVVAAAVVLVTIGWILVATRLAAADIEHSRAEGTARFEQLANARFLAQQARTDETLQLTERGAITESEKSFNEHMDDLSKLLTDGPPAAADAAQRWTASHRKQVEAYQRGDYSAAVAQAIGTDPGASAAQFTVVESTLHEAIEATRATLRDRVSSAGVALSPSRTGTLVLMMVAAAAVAAGLWPRLKEFL
jgi:hypothetical protein